MIKLALPVDGVRAGLLGGAPVCRDYMQGVEARARMLAKATRVKGARWQRASVGDCPAGNGSPSTQQRLLGDDER